MSFGKLIFLQRLVGSAVNYHRSAPVAQMDRVADYGSAGREFESHQACQFYCR